MSEGKVARRYAKALIEVANEAGAIEQVEKELAGFLSTINANEELKQVIHSPVFSVDERVDIVEALAKNGSWGELTHKIIMLLVKKERINSLSSILEAFSLEADKLADRMRAVISSAQPLSEDRFKTIVTSLEKRTGKKVVATAEVDESLMSGVRAQIGGLVFDGSLKARLQEMQRQLIH
jgi:F-type H+-transporting ATPase subunit delta